MRKQRRMEAKWLYLIQITLTGLYLSIIVYTFCTVKSYKWYTTNFKYQFF